jgi:hypothetical protein
VTGRCCGAADHNAKGAAEFRDPFSCGRLAARPTRNVTSVYCDQLAESMPGCGWGESNSHGLAPSMLRAGCVYQFRHTRPILWHSVVPVASTRSHNVPCRWPGESIAGGARCRFPSVRGGTDRREGRAGDRTALSSEATSFVSLEVCRPCSGAHRPNRSPVLPRRSITVGERSARSGPACVPRPAWQTGPPPRVECSCSRQGTPKGPRISATPLFVAAKPRCTLTLYLPVYRQAFAESMPGCGWGGSNSHGLAPDTV